MSSTIKERLTLIKTTIDSLFVNVTPAERPDVIKDLRDYLSLQNSAAKRPAYDKHTSNVTR